MASSVPRVKLGSQGLEVSQQGLGCMGMSAFYGPPGPEQEMIDLIHHAVESGVTFIDTADMYGPHTNEILVGKVGNQIPSILVMWIWCYISFENMGHACEHRSICSWSDEFEAVTMGFEV